MSNSYKKIPVTMRDHLHELTNAELKVWLYLYLRTGKELTSFPGNKTIAAACDMNVETAKIAKRGLRQKGWTQRVEQRRRDDGMMSTVVEKSILPWMENPATDCGKPSHGTVGGKSGDGKSAQHKYDTEVPEVAPTAIQQLPEVPPLTGGSELVSKSVVVHTFEKERATLLEFGSEDKTNPENFIAQEEFDMSEDGVSVEDNRPPKPQPLDGIEPLWDDVSWKWIQADEAYNEIVACFPALKATVGKGLNATNDEIRLMQEIIVHCANWAMFPHTAVDYARKHKQNTPGLIPRSVKGLHKAVFEGSSTNGLLAQTKEHDPQKCDICFKAIRGVKCERCGKGYVFMKPSGEVSEWCKECSKLPQYRRESGKRYAAIGE